MGDSMASTDSARERLCGMCVQQVIYCKHNKDVFFILWFGFGFIGFGWARGTGDLLYIHFVLVGIYVWLGVFGFGPLCLLLCSFSVGGGVAASCFGSDGRSGCLAGY